MSQQETLFKVARLPFCFRLKSKCKQSNSERALSCTGSLKGYVWAGLQTTQIPADSEDSLEKLVLACILLPD